MVGLDSGKRLIGHAGTVSSVAVSPGGDVVISGAHAHTRPQQEIRIWTLSDCKQLREIHSRLNGVFSLAVSPDSQYVAAGGGGFVKEGTWQYTSGVEICRLNDGRHLSSFGPKLFFVKCISFSRDGKLLLTCNLKAPNRQGNEDDYCVRLWRTDDFKMVSALGRHRVGVTSACFSIDSERVFFASNQTETQSSMQPTDHYRRHTLLSKLHLNRKDDVEVHNLNSMVPLIRVWNRRAQSEESPITLPKGRVEKIALSPDGRTLASCGSHVTIYDIEKRMLLRQFEQDTLSYTNDISFSPNGALLAAGSGYQFEPGINYENCGVKLWDCETGFTIASLPHQRPVHSLAFSPDGRMLVAGGESGELIIWDLLSLG